MKRAQRGCERTAEQVFRTCELILSGPVAESELRVERNFFTFSGIKDMESGSADGSDWERRGSRE